MLPGPAKTRVKFVVVHLSPVTLFANKLTKQRTNFDFHFKSQRLLFPAINLISANEYDKQENKYSRANLGW